jgi:DHA1 family bicyclomycin/chloramphenicol resistance-like MFS transporter
MGFTELVAFLAITMALNALAIDIVLPGLPHLGADLAVAEENRRQLVIVVYLISIGLSQIVQGPLADRIGRRATLLWGLAIYVAGGAACAIAPSFAALLTARAIQGLGAGALRIVAMSIARDRYRGTEMARVMSLVTMVFMAVPLLAPSLGQGILWVASWRWVFGAVTLGGVVVASWAAVRLEETLAPAHRRSLSPRAVGRAFAEVATTRATIVATLAMMVLNGALMAYVTSAQQIFQETFAAGPWFTILFALIALTIAVAAFTNARLVRAIGPARMARRALHAFITVAAVHVALAASGRLTLAAFEVLTCMQMLCSGFVGSNLSALALEPMGHMAGTASSVIGAVTIVGSAVIGGAIGSAYDGTARPFVIGTLLLVVITRALLALMPRDEQAVPAPA